MNVTKYLVVSLIAVLGVIFVYLVFGWHNGGGNGKEMTASCSNLVDTDDYGGLASTVAIIYEFGTVPAKQIQYDLAVLRSQARNQLVREIVLLLNHCKNHDTVDEAKSIVKSNGDTMKMIVLESDERMVSHSRARSEAVKHTDAQYLLFLTAGQVPTSSDFLDVMLHYLAEFPHAVIVPSIQSRSLQVSQLTWNLDLVPEVRELSQGKHVTEIPIVDDSAFMLRSELYHSVGGFDEFFYWPDSAGSIAFSLAVWLCGGSIAMTECAQVSGTGSQPQSGEQAIKYLQYAKYIQAVFGGSLVEYITYPGLEFYQRSQYDRHASENRRKMFAERNCLPFSWFAQKFGKHMKMEKHHGLYNPDYKPLLPLFESQKSDNGRWFVLFAGNCIKGEEDGILGLSWCPAQISSMYTFTWTRSGQLQSSDKCVTVSPHNDMSILDLQDCHNGETAQQFKYDASRRMVTSNINGQCVTHINGPDNRQVLSLMNCDDTPFNRFVFGGRY